MKNVWASVNKRDDLVPDYITRLKDSGFYGWPWYYIGPNQDPRQEGRMNVIKVAKREHSQNVV